MSTLAIILIVFFVLDLLLLVGGYLAIKRRDRGGEDERMRHIAEADQALEQARASDKGWDRAILEAAARKAVEAQRPGFAVESLDLVLVDDAPGVTQDRAQFLARGSEGELQVVLTRSEAGWAGESVG